MVAYSGGAPLTVSFLARVEIFWPQLLFYNNLMSTFALLWKHMMAISERVWLMNAEVKKGAEMAAASKEGGESIN